MVLSGCVVIITVVVVNITSLSETVDSLQFTACVGSLWLCLFSYEPSLIFRAPTCVAFC